VSITYERAEVAEAPDVVADQVTGRAPVHRFTLTDGPAEAREEPRDLHHGIGSRGQVAEPTLGVRLAGTQQQRRQLLPDPARHGQPSVELESREPVAALLGVEGHEAELVRGDLPPHQLATSVSAGRCSGWVRPAPATTSRYPWVPP